MSQKNFINFHVLISHSPSCLNRDDMNMQKSAIFGGKRRVRISSQSLKRAMRKSDYYAQHLGTPSERTRELGRLKQKYVAALEGQFTEEQVVQAIEWISGKEGLADDTQADAVAPWALDEVSFYCAAIASQGEDADIKKLEKDIKKSSKSFNEALSNTLDIALSGRMATSGLMSNMDGALAVAHAITTHAVDADIDWFTAVDDLVSDDGEVGAGHLNTQEFSSGVFYRYASLNLKQLQVNLGLIATMKDEETETSRQRALSVAKHVLHLLATVVPSAKQQSTAAFNLAEYALVSFSNQPISLANAFEKTVKNKEGFLKPSISELQNYWSNIHSGYGLDEQAAAFSLANLDAPESLGTFATIAELEQWIQSDPHEA